AAEGVPTIASLMGLWRRSLIIWPDGTRDTSTRVWWLQGPGFYGDLRQPRDAPAFDGTYRLADMSPLQLAWMSRQEAFAGELRFNGTHFEWERMIDLQPTAAHADCGRLRFEANVL